MLQVERAQRNLKLGDTNIHVVQCRGLVEGAECSARGPRVHLAPAKTLFYDPPPQHDQHAAGPPEGALQRQQPLTQVALT